MNEIRMKIRTNPSAKIYFLLNEYLLNPISFPLIGEGTYIKYSGGQKWAHVKLKINEIEITETTTLTWNNPNQDFPKIYEEEIIESLRTFLIHFEGLTGKNLKVAFEILDATYHQVETGKGNFYYAVANSILNAFDKTLHEPNVIDVIRYKNKI